VFKQVDVESQGKTFHHYHQISKSSNCYIVTLIHCYIDSLLH